MIPGVAVSVSTVMSQLEREPLETIVDPWPLATEYPTPAALGYIEVCQLRAELARSNASRGWADVGNLGVEDGVDPDTVVPRMYSMGAVSAAGRDPDPHRLHSEQGSQEHLELPSGVVSRHW